MQVPTSTGVAAHLLGTSEPRLNDLIRRKKIDAPPVLAGRRQWSREHIENAARVLGVEISEDLWKGEMQ